MKKTVLAPIALFVYKRPKPLEKVLIALEKNPQFSRTNIYAFCDGPKAGDPPEVLEGIAASRNILEQWQDRAKLTIIENSENFGLHKQIPFGVSYVLERHDRVIVLEDDILVSPFFLDYMNDALSIYAETEQVMQVSGFMFDVDVTLPETFFYNVNSCWGWGTWKRAWEYFDDNATRLLKQLTRSEDFSMYDFNGGQSNCFYDQLVKNHLGDLMTWAVKWHTCMYLMGGFCLHPKQTLVKNIGFDLDGTNCLGPDSRYGVEFTQKKINVEMVPLEKCSAAYEAVAKKFTQQKGPLKSVLDWVRKRCIPHLRGVKAHPVFGKYLSQSHLEELEARPRYFPGEIKFMENLFRYSDATTLLGGVIELFHENKYQFKASSDAPIIFDCGANIGLSMIYFKQMYPKAVIHAFEPDPELFELLKYNMASFSFSDVFLYNSAIWVDNVEVDFFSEGGFSGRICEQTGQSNELVDGVRLRDFLDSRVDFLKLDIEGAEVEVINDCQDRLHNIEHLFVEYHSPLGQKQQLDIILTALTNSGFRYQIKDVFSAKAPYLKVEQMAMMDLQLEIFAVKESKH